MDLGKGGLCNFERKPLYYNNNDCFVSIVLFQYNAYLKIKVFVQSQEFFKENFQ